MRQATFGLILVVLLIIAVACQDVLPETPIFQRITETSEPGRGVGGGIGILVDPTPTIVPGFWLFLDPPEGTCRELIEDGEPTAVPVWTRVTTSDPLYTVTNELRICSTYTGGARFNLRAIGYARGHSHAGDWDVLCVAAPLNCALSNPVPWAPPTSEASDCGLSGGTWQIVEPDETVVTLGPFVVDGDEEKNVIDIFMTTGTNVTCLFGCCPLSYHGYEITGIVEVIEGEGDCDSTTSPICISEINAMQDATPTTSAMKDYNLRGLQGANDEYVEVVCFEPMSAAGWSLSDGTSTYVYETDNFCWPLKAIFCDEMTDCDLETGFTDSGIWRLYDPDGNQRDVRSYPVMATPGNSWAAANYLEPEGAWVEIKPHPGTFPTATVTPTPTPAP